MRMLRAFTHYRIKLAQMKLTCKMFQLAQKPAIIAYYMLATFFIIILLIIKNYQNE